MSPAGGDVGGGSVAVAGGSAAGPSITSSDTNYALQPVIRGGLLDPRRVPARDAIHKIRRKYLGGN